MTRFYFDQAWFDSDCDSDLSDDWQTATSETPEWLEERLACLEFYVGANEEQQLIKRSALLLIVNPSGNHVEVIVIEVLTLGVMVQLVIL
jgi:hypothetical protein